MFPNRVALIGVDIQEDFINKHTITDYWCFDFFVETFATAVKKADTVILTKSAHPRNHFSFPELGAHCVKGTKGAKINKKILEAARRP